MISIDVQHDGELAKFLRRELSARIRMAGVEHGKRSKKWREAEETMMAYVPESEVDAERRIKREGGKPQYTTIKLPYTYAASLAAHTYWTTVFLSRDPVLQFMGLHGEGEMQIQALQALLGYNVQSGRHIPHYMVWFMDVAKYGEGWLMNHWEIEKRRVSEIVEMPEEYEGIILDPAKTKKVRKVTTVTGYEGNRVSNIAPMRVLTDPRVPRFEFQRGEFIAIMVELSWNQLLKGQANGRYINLDHINRRGGVGGASWGDHSLDGESGQRERPDPESYFTQSDEKTQSTMTRGYEVVIELVPKNWKLGPSDYPEKWVFTITADNKTVIEARPLGNLHDKFPIALLQAEMEAYAMFTRGITEILDPVQRTMDWLINSHLSNVRAGINNQLVFDPSRVEARDVMDPQPGKRIRLKPAAYGSDVRTAISQFQVQDMTQGHINDMQVIQSFGERLGFSDQVMGVGAPSSRRTAAEIRTTNTFSTGPLKTISEFMSATGFGDNARMLVSNCQQFYQAEKKFRIVGDHVNFAGEPFITVSPEAIAGNYDFVPVDGTLPIDRFAQANLWRDMLTQMSRVPQVMGQYDLGRIFAWVAQLVGLKNINQFKIQLDDPNQLALAAQSGNVVPMGKSQDPNRVQEPGQVSGLGPTV